MAESRTNSGQIGCNRCREKKNPHFASKMHLKKLEKWDKKDPRSPCAGTLACFLPSEVLSPLAGSV
jgi:hypothetical protein